MTSMDDLISHAHSELAGSAQVGRLDVGAADPPAAVVYRLEEYFGADDARDAVRLVVDGESVGYLARDDLDHLLPAAETKGVFDFDGVLLPGTAKSWHVLELHCPEPACAFVVLTTRFSASEPPLCEVHGRPMEPAR